MDDFDDYSDYEDDSSIHTAQDDCPRTYDGAALFFEDGSALHLELHQLPISVTPQEIVNQRRAGWPDFHPEDYCHKCGRRNIKAWHSPEWILLIGDSGGILCPVCFADLDPTAIWHLTRHREPDADRLEELTLFLQGISSLGDDAIRVARCVLDFLDKESASTCDNVMRELEDYIADELRQRLTCPRCNIYAYEGWCIICGDRPPWARRDEPFTGPSPTGINEHLDRYGEEEA